MKVFVVAAVSDLVFMTFDFIFICSFLISRSYGLAVTVNDGNVSPAVKKHKHAAMSEKISTVHYLTKNIAPTTSTVSKAKGLLISHCLVSNSLQLLS